MSYENLKLDRDKILPTLQSLGLGIVGPVLKGKEIHFQISYANEPDALLVFYYKKDGTTTISTSRGSNKQRSEELATIVSENCLFSNLDNISLYVKVSRDDFNDAIAYLAEECDATLDSETNISGGKQYQYSGSRGDRLTIKFFDKKQAMQVQGKPLFLYSDLIEILCELLPYEQIVKPQFEARKIECTTTEILSELQVALPNAYDFLQDKTRAIISPSLALRRIDIELTDYTAFVMPALRGLEAYLKQLFLLKGISVDSHKGFGSYLTGSIPAKLNSSTTTLLGCSQTVSAIESSYQYWSSQRHVLSHVDGVVSTTRILTRTEADQILCDVLRIIDESYAPLLS